MQGHWRNDVSMWFIFIRIWSSGSCEHDTARLGFISGEKQNKSAQEVTLVTCLRGGRCSDVAGTTITLILLLAFFIPSSNTRTAPQIGPQSLRFMPFTVQQSYHVLRFANRTWRCAVRQTWKRFRGTKYVRHHQGTNTRRRVPEHTVIIAFESRSLRYGKRRWTNHKETNTGGEMGTQVMVKTLHHSKFPISYKNPKWAH